MHVLNSKPHGRLNEDGWFVTIIELPNGWEIVNDDPLWILYSPTGRVMECNTLADCIYAYGEVVHA